METNKQQDEAYYKFEFLSEMGGVEKSSSASAAAAATSSGSKHNYINSFFILDVYAGTIHTSKLLDLENFCDLSLCKNRLLKVVNSSTTTTTNNAGESNNNPAGENCLIEFKIKATRLIYPNASSSIHNYSSLSIKETISSVYHISFDLLLRDVNEFKPEFIGRQQQLPIWFNVSEEFAPIKLAVGSVAFDNDCNDRGRLSYVVRVVKVNGRLFDEWLAEMRHFLASKSSPYADFLQRSTNRTLPVSNIFEFMVSFWRFTVQSTVFFSKMNYEKSIKR